MSRYDSKTWTFGAELELADLDRHATLPAGVGWDDRDYTMVNSNGIAVDPKGKTWPRGGEICMRPETGPFLLQAQFEQLMELFPDAKANYRSNLHIHIRVPGLKEDLQALLILQKFVHDVLPGLLPIIEPIPKPRVEDYPTTESFEGAMKRYRRRRGSHQTFLTQPRVSRQLKAASVEEFMCLEVPTDRKGKPLWHCQPRSCVNIRQLQQTDTIEFRHFPGTTNQYEFVNAVTWCKLFMEAALLGMPTVRDLANAAADIADKLPRFQPYDHELERRYLLTAHDGSVPKADIPGNIQKILNGELP